MAVCGGDGAMICFNASACRIHNVHDEISLNPKRWAHISVVDALSQLHKRPLPRFQHPE
jgi:hypothetical protein